MFNQILYLKKKSLGYEIIGLDHIPLDGPAIIVFYHSYMPLDAFLIISEIFFKKNRRVIPIVERSLFKVPGKWLEFY